MAQSHMIALGMQISFSCTGGFGFAITFLNTPVEEFKVYLNKSHNYEQTEEEYDAIWNVIQNIWFVGFFFGFFVAPVLNDVFGRKVALLCGNFGNLLMSIMQWAGVHYYLPQLLVFGRLFSALFTAISFQAMVLYLQEFPPSKDRGRISYLADTLMSFFAFVSMSLGTRQLLGNYLSLLMAVQVLFAIISVFFTLRMPESPKFLLLKKKSEGDALQSIHFFHGSNNDNSAAQFIEELKRESAEEDGRSSWKDVMTAFADPALRKTILLGLSATQMTVPLWTLLFNSTDLLLDLGASILISQWTSSGMVVCYFFGCVIGSNLIDRLGRRTLLIPCSAICAASVAALAATFYLIEQVPRVEIIAVLALLLNGLMYGIGVGCIAWFITTELAPQRYRSLLHTIVAILNMLQSVVFTFAVMPLYRAFGAVTFLVMFTLLSAFCDIFLYCKLPETKGRQIADITDEIKRASSKNVREYEEAKKVVDATTKSLLAAVDDAK